MNVLGRFGGIAVSWYVHFRLALHVLRNKAARSALLSGVLLVLFAPLIVFAGLMANRFGSIFGGALPGCFAKHATGMEHKRDGRGAVIRPLERVKRRPCSSALDSTALASYGLPGPGRFVSIYANSGHAFIYVGGLRFDTVFDRSYDSGPNSGKSGPRWRVYPSVPGWASWTVRHPEGL
jgi:hypothetical protein